MNNEQAKNYTVLKIIFRLLPVLGLACIIFGLVWAIWHVQIDKLAYISIGLGVALFLTLFAKAEAANLKFYLNVLVYSVVVAGICVVIYLFANQYTQKVDLTKQKLYSLSDQSEKYLKKLNKPVRITIFYEAPDPFQEIMDLYKGTTDKVEWRVINARKDPVEAKRYGDNVRNGDMFVEAVQKDDKATTPGAEAKRKKLSLAELNQNYENVITNAIIEVTRGEKTKIYFLSGHGEVAYDAPASMGPRQQEEEAQTPSLSAFKRFLGDRGIETAQLDLGRTGFVPQDASMLVLAGPKSDLLAPEVTALQNYLDKNGKMLVMFDVPQTNFNVPLGNLQGLLAKYGVDAPDKVVIDLESQMLVGNPIQPIATWFNPDQPITRFLGSRPSRFVLSITRPITKAAQVPQGLEVTDLMKSSEQSFSESLATVVANRKIAPPSQLAGQPLGVAVSKAAPRSMPGQPAPPADKNGMRLVVFGTSDLVQNSYLSGNQMAIELMLNTVNWLAVQEDMIAVPPRQVEGTPIILDKGQLRLIFLLAVILIPATLFFGGTSYSILRRRR